MNVTKVYEAFVAATTQEAKALIEKLTVDERRELALYALNKQKKLIARQDRIRRSREDLQMKFALMSPYMTDDTITVAQAAARIPCRRKKGGR